MNPGRVGGLAVAAVAVLVVTLTLGVGATPARLTAVAPGNGSVVTGPPAEVALTFNAPADPAETHVAVARAAGTPIAVGAPRLSGDTVLVPVDIVAPGAYVVGYHVVLGGGRQVSGTTRFTVLPGAPTPAVLPPTTGPGPEDLAALGDGHDHGGVDPLSLAVILVNGVGIAGIVVVMLRRPRIRG